MNYSEVVKIPAKCADCPWLDTLAGVHDIEENTKAELSDAIISGQIDQGLFALMLEEGMSIDEAEQTMTEKVEEIRKFNIEALENLDDHQATLISLGRKLLQTCEHGVYVDSDDKEIVVCMSSLAGIVSASIQEQ